MRHNIKIITDKYLPHYYRIVEKIGVSQGSNLIIQWSGLYRTESEAKKAISDFLNQNKYNKGDS